MERIFYVYIYYDPRNNQPFYVGKGCNTRYLDHLREAENIVESNDFTKENNQRRLHKINSIKRNGLEPKISFYAKNLTNDQAYQLEDFLLTIWGRKDFDENGILFNILEPGNRSPNISGEDHYNYGQPGAMLGKKLNEKQIERLRKAKTGKKRKPFSQEWLDKLAESNRGKNNGMYGKKHKPETIELIRKRAQERKNSSESNLKRAETTRKIARQRAERIIPYIQEILDQNGRLGPQQIANRLNDQGLRTDRGKLWRSCSVNRILKYIGD